MKSRIETFKEAANEVRLLLFTLNTKDSLRNKMFMIKKGISIFVLIRLILYNQCRTLEPIM